MRLLSARLIVSLIIGVTLVSLSSAYYEVLVQKQSLRRDLQRRAEVLGESLARNVERELDRDSIQALQRTVQRFGNREHLLGLAVYDHQGRLIAITKDLAPLMPTAPPVMSQALNENHGADVFQRLGAASVNIYALPCIARRTSGAYSPSCMMPVILRIRVSVSGEKHSSAPWPTYFSSSSSRC